MSPAGSSTTHLDDAVFRTLVESALQGILVHRNQRPLFVNESWAALHGHTVEEVLALDDVLSLIHPEDQPRMLGYMKCRMRGEEAPEQYEYRALHRDGSIRWLENRVRVIDWHGEPSILATVVDVTGRRRMEQTLRESEERFRRGFEDGPIGICFVGSDLSFLRANRAFCEMVGYSEKELQSRTTLDLTADEDYDLDSGKPDTAIGNYGDFTTRKPYRHRDGRLIWVRLSAHWIRDDAGNPQYRMTLVEDISDRVKDRRALQASERRFRDLVEGSIQGILIHRDDRPLFVNEAWAQLLGYETDEVLAADSTLSFIAPHDRERMDAYRQARAQGEPAPHRYEYQGLHKDGSLVWLENNVRLIDWDGRPAIQSTIIDVSERKLREQELETFNEELERRVLRRTNALRTTNERLEAEIAERERIELELRHSRSLYESLVESIPLCVARKDLEGRFVFANRALRELFGKPLDQIVGRDDYEFSPADLSDKYRADDLKVITTGEQLEFVEVSELAEGHRHIHTLKTPIYDTEGRINGTQLIFWDITDQVLAEEERRAAQEALELRNRDLSSLLYVISHDLKEPLRAIRSFPALIHQRCAEQLDERSLEFLQHVIDGGARMEQLIDDVLMLARAQQSIDPSLPVDLNEVVRDVLLQLKGRIEETGARIDVQGDLPVVSGDRRWLQQAIQNLVANALKFTMPDEPPQVEIAAWVDPDSASKETGIVVRDRGTGVSEKHAERIFDLFQRAVGRGVEGTGAGLAIVRQVAERHSGRAFVEPRDGGGSEFVITMG